MVSTCHRPIGAASKIIQDFEVSVPDSHGDESPFYRSSIPFPELVEENIYRGNHRKSPRQSLGKISGFRGSGLKFPTNPLKNMGTQCPKVHRHNSLAPASHFFRAAVAMAGGPWEMTPHNVARSLPNVRNFSFSLLHLNHLKLVGGSHIGNNNPN